MTATMRDDCRCQVCEGAQLLHLAGTREGEQARDGDSPSALRFPNMIFRHWTAARSARGAIVRRLDAVLLHEAEEIMESSR